MFAEASEIQQQPDTGPSRTRAGKVRLRTLGDMDARTAAYRRFKELVASYSSDLGGDLTTGQSAIVQRAVSLQVWLEDCEARYAESGELDIQTYTTGTNALRRLLSDIGIERRSRDITPTLNEWQAQMLARKGAAAPQAAE